MKTLAAAGHQHVCQVAIDIMAQGGNAFDAAAAAGFMSALAEPGLSSLGGGGFLLASSSTGQATLYDFFTDTPGLGGGGPRSGSDFFPVTVSFSGSDQDFHVGKASVAVPGCLAGYLHFHKKLGVLPLARCLSQLSRPAVRG